MIERAWRLMNPMKMMVLAFLLTSRVAAQEPNPGPMPADPPQPAPTPSPTGKPTPTAPRLDFAMAQWRLDQWITAHPPKGELADRVNREWDRGTILRHRGAYLSALLAMNEALVIAQSDPATAPAQRVLCSQRVRMAPPVYILNRAQSVTADIRSLYPVVGAPSALKCVLQIVGTDGKVILESPFELTINADGWVNQAVQCDVTGKSFLPGSYWVQLSPPSGQPVVVTRWIVVPNSLSAQSNENAKLLNQINPNTPLSKSSMTSARGRNDLLVDGPVEDQTISLLLDLERLSREVNHEISEIQAGKDPYLRRPGDVWRALDFDGQLLPYRVYAPKSVCGDAQTPAPLVIMLNMMGGDENTLFDLCGNGEIKRIAEQQGFVAVSADVQAFATDPSKLQALVLEMVRCYPIDRSRLYLIGHATGAEVINRWLKDDLIRCTAACFISGGAWFHDMTRIPPTLVVSGEYDALVPPTPTEQSCQTAITGGLPVTFLMLPETGHSSVIGAAMPDIIKWLLQQKSVTANP